jgi:tight adherence protein B
LALIVLAFVIIAVMTFLLVMLFTRRSSADRSLERRIAGIQVTGAENAYLGAGVPEFIKRNKLSNIPWLDGILQQWDLAHKIRLLLVQAESSWTVSTVLVASVVLGGMGLGIARYWIPELIPAVALGLLAAGFPTMILRVQRSRRLDRFDKGLPDALDLLTRALRAGHSIAAAIEIVSEESEQTIRNEFREVYTQQNFGMPYRDALLQLAHRVPSPDLRFVVTAMLLQKETGGNLVDILDRTSAVLRDRVRIRGEIRIYTAQGRLTGVILGLLPIVMFILINFANPGYTSVLLDDPVGRKIMYLGALLMAVGALLIRKIVKVKV